MSISVKCPECGRGYSLKEEFAGKKFRCKECQAPVTVPEPEADPWETDDFGDYEEDYEDDYERQAPALPKKRKKPAPKPKKKPPKRRSSSGAGIGPMIGKVVGGVFGFLVAFGLVFRLVSGGGFGVSWESYTTPDGNITVQMPGKVKSVPVRDMVAGGQSYGAESRNFACIVIIEPMPPELANLSEDEIQQAMEVGSTFLGARNVQTSSVNGRPCITFEKGPTNGLNMSGMAFLYKNKVYTLNYAYKGSNRGSNERKFFDSIQFN